MTIGSIINDVHPCLKTISFSEIDQNLDKPILIVGFEHAVELFPNLTLETKVVDENKSIYYSYSKEESEIKYQEHLENFIKHCFETTAASHKVVNIVDLSTTKINAKEVFVYETPTSLSITTQKRVYYLNKELIKFFNNLELSNTIVKKLLPPKTKIISWDCKCFFGAYMKAENKYKSKEEVKLLYKPYGDVDLYMGVLCRSWLQDFKGEISTLKLWERAYNIESSLSALKVKIDTQKVKLLSANEDNLVMQTIYKFIEDGYIKQKYNGTDKLTGRIYPHGSGFSLQTLPKHSRDIIIAEPNCVLVEFDYNYFEYTLLSQLCEIDIKGDPHVYMSKLLFNDDLHRDIAKGINYSLLYGKSLENTLKEIRNEHGITVERSKLKKITDPIEGLQKKLAKELKKNGYIVNYFGRQIFPDKPYACLNNYTQSTAAEMVIIKLEKLFLLLRNYSMVNKVFLQNHDSILLNLHLEDLEETEIASEIKNLLESPEEKLSATVDVKYGANWGNVN